MNSRDLQNAHELISVVCEDLKWIKEELSVENVSDHQLRRISTVLRRLIIDDHIVRCWKLVDIPGHYPVVVAPYMDTECLSADAFAVAGGARLRGGMVISNFVVEKRGKDGNKKQKKNDRSELSYFFPFHEYKLSTCLWIKGKKINRSDVIQYVANKKGGNHLDFDRLKRKDKERYVLLDELVGENAWQFGGMIAEGQVGKFSEGKNPIYLELLAIVQHLVESPDILDLITKCEEILE